MTVKGALASILPRITARIYNHMCIRGSHIYSHWQISDNPIVDKIDITQDVGPQTED